MVNFDKYIEKLKFGEIIDGNQIISICDLMKETLFQESNIVPVSSPVVICGDIHGQFYDLMEMFKTIGDIPNRKFIFMGDFVDRGRMSVETITLLCCYKLMYPEHVTLIRGNHESRQLNQIYGFYTECSRKYRNDPRVWKAFTDMFDYLPLGVLVDDELLCIHGGLSPSIHSLDQLRLIHRFEDVPTYGPFSDILWSDPDPTISGFSISPRGAGFLFGGDIVQMFLHSNNLNHISRAHQLCMEGYQVQFDGSLSTVWSAPNYVNRFGNKATCMLVNGYEKSFEEFEAADKKKAPLTKIPGSSDVVDLGYFV